MDLHIKKSTYPIAQPNSLSSIFIFSIDQHLGLPSSGFLPGMPHALPESSFLMS